jgi:hypothetical protein
LENISNECIKSEYNFNNKLFKIFKYSLIYLLIIAFAILIFPHSFSSFEETFCIPLLMFVLFLFLILLPIENTFILDENHITISYKNIVTITKIIPLPIIKSLCISSNYLIRIGHLETIEIETKIKHFSICFVELKKNIVLSMKKVEIKNNDNTKDLQINSLIKININTILLCIFLIEWIIIVLQYFILGKNA